MTRSVIIVNAKAGRGQCLARVGTLRSQLRDGERLIVTSDEASLAQAAADVVATGAARVSLLGGDGTIATTLTALQRASPRAELPAEFVLLGGGTMNTVARGLGATGGPPEERLRRARAVPYGAGRPVRPLVVNGQLGFLLSTGLMHQFLVEYYAQGDPSSVGAARLLARGILSSLRRGPLARRLSARFTARLTLDGTPLPERDCLFVGVGTVPEVGLGFRPYARASPERGFHVVAYSGSIAALAFSLAAFARGRGEVVAGTFDRTGFRLTIEAQGAEPIPFALDGDLHPAAAALHVGLGPTIRIV